MCGAEGEAVQGAVPGVSRWTLEQHTHRYSLHQYESYQRGNIDLFLRNNRYYTNPQLKRGPFYFICHAQIVIKKIYIFNVGQLPISCWYTLEQYWPMVYTCRTE